MTITDRTNLLMLEAKSLEEAVKAYAKARKETNGYVWVGRDVPIHHTKEAIERRIVQMRQDLNVLREGLTDESSL